MRHYLLENRLGNPAITSIFWLTSHTSIHHLYHLIRFEQVNKVSLNQTTNVIEFGGGYGNIAKIYRRINPSCTYVIIDLPVVCCIQYVYLSTLLGRDSVYFVSDTGDRTRIGKINLVPIRFMEYLEDIPNGLFVSTWGLSEATAEAQSFIQKKKFFNTKSILLAFQANNDTFQLAENVVSLVSSLKDKCYHLEEIPFLKNNYYLFA